MEKISSILPSSPRVRKVDLSESAPVRPGTPTFGRPVGVNAIKDRLSISEQAKDLAFQETLGGVNPKEARSVKIAEQMTKRFFDEGLANQGKPRAASEESQQRNATIQEDLPRIPDTQKNESAAVPMSSEKLDLQA